MDLIGEISRIKASCKDLKNVVEEMLTEIEQTKSGSASIKHLADIKNVKGDLLTAPYDFASAHCVSKIPA